MVLPIVAVLWLAVCIGGVAALWRYKTTPGDDGAPPARWPADSAIARADGAPTLVMLVHPRCPCSRASLYELNEVMHRARDATAAVVFVQPAGTGEAWVRGESWDRAHQIPRTTVLVDRGGVEARRFGVAVSGHTLVYDAGGARVFSGGITGARGHQGDNPGRRQLFAALGDSGGGGATPVFGCALAEEK